MKLLILVSGILAATNLSAATSKFKRSSIRSNSIISLKSIQPRMTLVRPLSADSSYTQGTNTNGESPTPRLGVSLGIQDIKTKSIGYIASISQFSMSETNNDLSVRSLELSGTYGIQDNAYLLIGFNRSELSYSSLDLRSRNGMQFGIGYRHNKDLSFELIRRELNGERDNLKAEVETLDLNINLLL